MTVTLAIERMTYGPSAIAHDAEGRAIFIDGVCPGETVRATVTEEHARYARAELDEVLTGSVSRVAPGCPNASICGGCPWQHLGYASQLASKRDIVLDSLQRIGHIDAKVVSEAFRDIHPSDREWGYRNKVEFDAYRRPRLKLGMHSYHGDLVEIGTCPLLPKRYAKAAGAVSGALRFLSGEEDLGIERVGVRASLRSGDAEVAIWTEAGGFPRAAAAKVLSSAVKGSSVTRVVLKGTTRSRKVSGVEAISGNGCWKERIDGRTMILSAPSFFQVNTSGAEKLIGLVMDHLQPSADDHVLDLYCGAGTFTLPLAASGAFVSGVESYGSSIRDLRRNLEVSGLDAEVIGGDVERELAELVDDASGAVIDPPRSGLAPSVTQQLVETPLKRLVYVSCDPTTLARDLARLTDKAYRIDAIDCVDLFPQDHHVETVVALSRIG